MKLLSNFLMRSSFLVALFIPSLLQAESPEYQSELFKKTKLIYEDKFDGPINKDFWEIRQSSTWVIKDGVLSGSSSSKEFQEKMIAKGDKAHAGFKPVIWLKQVPENFVCTMRLKYSAEKYHPRFPLLDLGHHIHTLVFGEKLTTLKIKKDRLKYSAEKYHPRFPLLDLGHHIHTLVFGEKSDHIKNQKRCQGYQSGRTVFAA